MKKSMILVAALAAVSFTSCKKDRTCSCTSTIVDAGTSYSYGTSGQVAIPYSTTTTGSTNETKYNKISQQHGDQACPVSSVDVLAYDNTSTVSIYTTGTKGSRTTTKSCTLK